VTDAIDSAETMLSGIPNLPIGNFGMLYEIVTALSRISPRVRVRDSVSIVYRIAPGGYSWIWPLLLAFIRHSSVCAYLPVHMIMNISIKLSALVKLNICSHWITWQNAAGQAHSASQYSVALSYV